MTQARLSELRVDFLISSARSERTVRDSAKATKDLLQVAALAAYFMQAGQTREFNAAWRDLVSRGRGWRDRARQGRTALLKLAPALDLASLWKE